MSLWPSLFTHLIKKTCADHVSYSLHTPNTLLGLVVRASALSVQSDYKDLKKSSNGFPCLHSGFAGIALQMYWYIIQERPWYYWITIGNKWKTSFKPNLGKHIHLGMRLTCVDTFVNPFPHIDSFWHLCSRRLFWKHSGKRRSCSKQAISPFATMFSTFSHRLSIQL